MTRLRRFLPLVAVALGAILVPVAVGSATAPPDTTEPASSVPGSSAPASSDPVDGAASGARRRWLEFVDESDPDTFAGGALLRDLVDGRRVLMIGDSIMASTSRRYGGDMCAELVPRGWEVEIDAETGRFVDFGDRVLDARLDADWDAAVVMLGNNYGADQAVFEEYLAEIVDRLAPRPTVLLTVTEFRPGQAEVNEVIYDVAAENDNVRVVDWAAETADDPALVGGDGLHLSDLGRARYADLVGRELGRAPGSGEGDCLSSNFTDDSAILPQPGQVPPPPTNRPTGGGATVATSDDRGTGDNGCTRRAHDCPCSGSDDSQPPPPTTSAADRRPPTTAADARPPAADADRSADSTLTLNLGGFRAVYGTQTRPEVDLARIPPRLGRRQTGVGSGVPLREA